MRHVRLCLQDVLCNSEIQGFQMSLCRGGSFKGVFWM